MNYSLSKSILSKIKTSRKILVSTHKHPDYDSIGSVLALEKVLRKLGKEVKIISCQKINPHFFFLRGADKIDFIDFTTFDFRLYDLFIIPDTGSYDRVTGSKEVKLPKKIDYIVIDHHKTNNFSGSEKLLDETASAAGEILYNIFEDWKIKIDKETATFLLAGILGDTVFLRYCENNKKTIKVVSELVEKEADKDLLSENFYERYDFDSVKMLGEFLCYMKAEGRFIWSALPYEVYEKYGKPEGIREMAADLFFRGIKGTDFGIAMLESKKGVINLSFRSKKNTDVTKLAKIFGGGGHKNAAGATVYGDFEKTVKKAINQIITTLRSQPPRLRMD